MMKMYIAMACILTQAWTLSACAANADSSTSEKQVNINNETYTILTNVMLIKDPNHQRIPGGKIPSQIIGNSVSSQSTNNHTTQDTKAIASFGNMKLVPVASLAAQQALDSNPNKEIRKSSSLYVQNNSSGKVSIVNGEIFATTQSADQAQAIANGYPIELVSFLARHKMALFEAPADERLFDIVNRMKSDSRMSQVKLRLINNLNVAH